MLLLRMKPRVRALDLRLVGAYRPIVLIPAQVDLLDFCPCNTNLFQQKFREHSEHQPYHVYKMPFKSMARECESPAQTSEISWSRNSSILLGRSSSCTLPLDLHVLDTGTPNAPSSVVPQQNMLMSKAKKSSSVQRKVGRSFCNELKKTSS